METTILATPRDLIAALTPNRLYWRDLSRRFEDLDVVVHAIVSNPMFQHTYGTVHGTSEPDMMYDVRSAASLMTANVFTLNELDVLMGMDLAVQMNHGLALAARHLRSQAPNIPPENFVTTVRLRAFSFILKLVGEDLKDPRPVLTELVGKLDFTDAERMSLLQAALANVTNKSSKIVLH